MTAEADKPARFLVIAIDGGAASGKSSTSRLLAGRYNLLHVDTGSHYRAVALACLEAGVPPEEGASLQAFLDRLALGSRIQERESLICFQEGPPPAQKDLRSEAVNSSVSAFAALPAVRQAVKRYQRGQVELARISGFNGIIMDGRDIGTVILPDADLKVFLVADPATRQKRRTLEGARDAIAARDKTDSTRRLAPLKPAADAVLLDNSALSLEEVVDRVGSLVDRLAGQ